MPEPPSRFIAAAIVLVALILWPVITLQTKQLPLVTFPGTLTPSDAAFANVRVNRKIPSLSLTENFTPNALTISTSEGAPYGFCDFWVQTAASCAHESNFGYGPTTILHIYICLSGQVSVSACSRQPRVAGPLSLNILEAINSRIGTYYGTGIRLVV